MTVRVVDYFAEPIEASQLAIAKPMRGVHNAAWIQELNHLLGWDKNVVHEMQWGSTESASATYRFLHQAGQNVSALVFSFMTRGNTFGIGGTPGTITIAGGSNSPLEIWGLASDVSDLGDLTSAHAAIGILPVTPGAFAEYTYVTDHINLHSLTVWELPKIVLEAVGSQNNYLDRTYASTEDFISDNDTTADPNGNTRRGHRALCDAMKLAREEMARSSFIFVNPGVTVNPAALSTWTDVPGFDNLRTRGRLVKGGATANSMRTRAFAYAGAVSAGTWEFRVVGTAQTSGSSSAFTAGGWKGSTSPPTTLGDGVSWDILANATDTHRLQVQQTAGGATDTVTINGFGWREHPLAEA